MGYTTRRSFEKKKATEPVSGVSLWFSVTEKEMLTWQRGDLDKRRGKVYFR
jgi:hypothetical protein